MAATTSTPDRRRSARMELRTTPSERELIDRAVVASGTDLTGFVVASALEAARRVLADRQHFELSADDAAQWAIVNSRRPRDLPGLRRLMQRPSPFDD